MENRTTEEILQDVAAGRLDPAEAARLLDEAANAEAHTPADAPSGEAVVKESPPAPMVPEIDRVMVRATSRRIRIIGDPSVATVAVDGAHTVRRDISTLVITGETELVPTDDAFMLLAGGNWREVASRVQQNFGRDLGLEIRVRPDLAVGAEIIAGSLQTENVRSLDHVRITAGSVRIQGSEEPIDVLMQAGSGSIETRQVHGTSRVRCESGSLQITLLDGSDVRVRSDVQLGRFSTQPERRSRDRGRDVVVGTGAAEMGVEIVMGSVTLKTPEA